MPDHAEGNGGTTVVRRVSPRQARGERSMHLPGFGSGRSRADRRALGRYGACVSRRPTVERLERRALLDASSAGHPPAVNDPIGGPAADAATMLAQLKPAEVDALLRRATAADPYNDAIIAVTDRGGRVLGVRVEDGVSSAITSDPDKLVFAVDGALAEARTGAFFANDQAPLTSRTIQDLSQSTITQREVQSDPSITDVNSTTRGPASSRPWGSRGTSRPGSHTRPRSTSTRSSTLTATASATRTPTGRPGPPPPTSPSRAGSTSRSPTSPPTSSTAARS